MSERASGAVSTPFATGFAVLALLLVPAVPVTTPPGPRPAALHAQARGGAAAFDTTAYRLEYRSIGPERGGRSTAVAGIPGEPETFLMGATGGGVWKTTDAGLSWENLSDGHFEAGSIGAIRVAEGDPSVIYVGTGSACLRGNVSKGIGMYRSEDGGKTWRHVGLREAGQIGRIAVHPSNPDVAFAAALGSPFGPNPERGVFRTRDGGESWEKVLFVSDSTGFVDLAMNPKNPRVVFAAAWRAERKPWTLISGAEEAGIWRTKDGGDTWEKLEGGLPTGVVGKAAVTVSPADPDRVWVLIEAEGDKGGVYRSDDGGDSWTQVNRERMLRQRAWYYTHIYADPQDENTVYALNVRYWKSVDGGKTWESVRVPHGDVHDLWLNPDDPKKQVVADDGGGQVTLTGGESWSTYYNQPTAEFYRVFVDDRFPYHVYGPQQDNSTIRVPSRPLPGVSDQRHWQAVGGCESGHIAIDPRDPDIVYAGCYGGSIERTDLKTGDERQILAYPQLQLGQAARDLEYRFQWNAPIRIDPHDPDVVYHTSNHVHRSRDNGHSWETISPDLTRDLPEHQGYAGEPITRDNTGVEVFGTIFAFEISPHEPGVLWAGSDDGRLHISRDDGETWNEITPPGLPEISTVNTIELSAHDPGRAFVTAYRYRQDDFTPYIFRTSDYGASWERVSTEGIPADHSARVVREDPERRGLLYAGTEFGMYVSFDDGGSWRTLQSNLPVTPITDLRVHEGDLVVATQGRSFWILDDLSPLRQLTPEVAASRVHLYQPAPAVRARGVFGTGATIAYHLGSEPAEDENLVIEVLEPDGDVVRRWASDPSAVEDGDDGVEADEIEEEDRKPGLNRIRWNLSYEGPDLVDDAVIWGFTGGQTAVPGTYTVRLTLGEMTQEQQLEVRMDPRLEGAVTAEDLRARFELATRTKGMLQEAHDAIRDIRSVRSQVKDRAQRAAEADYGEDLTEMADSVAQKLTAIEEELMQTKNESNQDPLNFPPMLDNQIAYLYGYIRSTEDRPTEGARQRADDLRAELDGHLSELRRVMEEDVAPFERTLEERGVPPVIRKGEKAADAATTTADGG